MMMMMVMMMMTTMEVMPQLSYKHRVGHLAELIKRQACINACMHAYILHKCIYKYIHIYLPTYMYACIDIEIEEYKYIFN